MALKNKRFEVMQFLEKDIDALVEKYLIPPEKIWQPTDFLPDSESNTEAFFHQKKYGNQQIFYQIQKQMLMLFLKI